MKINYLKYLTIPIMVCITSTFFIQIYFYLYACWFNYDFIKYFSIINNLAIPLLLGFLILFVGTLIFSIAYKQTRLTLHNALYILAVALIIVPMAFILTKKYNIFILIESFSFLLEIITTYFFDSLFIPITALLAITGINYLYAKINKLTVNTINNKLICMLYIGLLISLSLYHIFIANMSNLMELPTNKLLLVLIINTISLIILAVYYYAWLSDLLTAKNTTHYPVKIMLAFSLNILLLAITFILLTYVFLNIFYSFDRQNQLSLLLVIVAMLILYVIDIFLFIKIRSLSSSCIYRTVHWLLYIIAFIATVVMLIYESIHGINLLYAFIVFYGVILFAISLSLYVLYIANKLAINLVFKNNNDQLKEQPI